VAPTISPLIFSTTWFPISKPSLLHPLYIQHILMSHRDPSIHGPFNSCTMNVTKFLNPGATSYAPGSQPKPGMTSQVSATPTPSSDLAARVLNLENGHVDLQADVDALTELYHKLRSSVDGLELSGQSATVGPFQQQESTQAHQSALRFKQELKELTSEAHKAVDSFTNVEKSNGTTMPKASASVPPHVRGMNGTSNGAVQQKSIPPHLRAKGTNG
jgi:hypothetical protein